MTTTTTSQAADRVRDDEDAATQRRTQPGLAFLLVRGGSVSGLRPSSPRSRSKARNRGILSLFRTAVVLSLALAAPLFAADNERPVGFRARCTAIVGATVHVRPGETLSEATVILRDGLIEAVGEKAAVPPDAEVIDAKGLVLYAGFIDAGSSELIDPDFKPPAASARTTDFARYALAATASDHRHGLTPALLAAEALKLRDDLLEQFRQTGFTSAHVVPTGRIASGQGAVLSLSGAPQRESLLAPATFQSLQLSAFGGNVYPSTLMGAIAHLRQAFLDAEHARTQSSLYEKGTAGIARPPVDTGWNALQELRDGRRRALFLANTRDDIHRALDFASEQKLKPLIWGGRDARLTIDRLAGRGADGKRDEASAGPVDVLLSVDFGDEPKIVSPAGDFSADSKDPTLAQQFQRDEWQRRTMTAADLHDAGVRFAFSSRGIKSRPDFLKQIRQTIKSGLSADHALAALTTNAASILGAGDRLGVVAPGKLAHVVVMTGRFEDPQSKVRYTFIDDRRYEYNKEAKPVVASLVARPEPAKAAGKWALDIASADGRVTAELVLSQEGNRLTGTFTSEQGNGRVVSGAVQENKVDFTVGIGAGDRTVELKFHGTLGENKLTGELRPAFGASTKWSATRAAEEKSSPNPVQLALEDPPAGAKEIEDAPAMAEIPATPEGSSAPTVRNQRAKIAAIPSALDESRREGQPVELPSDRTARPIETAGNVLIRGGTVLTGTGKTLEKTSILVRNGKIAAIGPDLAADAGMAVIDASGRYVMPGIIDTHSHIMITGGINEATQSIVCEVRVRDIIHSDDVFEYRALAGGVTAARILHGSANVIGGQDAVVKLKHGLPASEHILHDAPQGVKFALGENVKFQSNRFPNTRLGVEATLNRAFFEGLDYRRRWREYENALKKGSANPQARVAGGTVPNAATGGTGGLPASGGAALLPPRRDLRLETLADIIDHRKFIHSHCYRSDEILMLLNVAANHGIRVWSLQHVLEGYKVAPEIVAHGASCSTFADWWAYKVEAFDAIPSNAALLEEAGANVCIKSDDWELIRHLAHEASKTVRHGNMPPDKALAAITLNPARELGLHERMGSIEVGKDADLGIYSGHPLNSLSRCEMTLIEGIVYFSREHSPSAMLPEMSKASASPPALPLAQPALRRRPLDTASVTGTSFALVNAALHPIDSADIPRGTVIVAEGKIQAIGADIAVPNGVPALDVDGLHVYPGLIDAGTTIGLIEIGKVRETHDTNESGQFQPDLRAGIAINPDSELLPVARIGGITTALIRPAGGVISGQASLMKLAGWTAPEMVLDYTAGLQINWPSGDDAAKKTEQLTQLFKEGRFYDELCRKADADSAVPRPIADPRYDALRPYLRGEKPVFIEANTRKEIVEAVLFAEKEKLKIVVTGASDAWKVADELKKRDIPLIVGPVMRAPVSDFDPFDAPYANPGRLHAAGVRFCIRSNNAANSRNTPFEAAMAAAYGLPEAAALRSVTLSSAEILGLADKLGSISPGKTANLIVADGSPLQPTSQLKALFIDGRPIPLESRQTKFYDRYRQRLHETQRVQPAATK